MRIDACFDSHVHWAASGEFAERLNLRDLKAATDILQLAPDPHALRGGWILGFGWDETGWPEAPHREVLDRWFPNTPVALTRVDGHALWVNSEALKRVSEWRETPGGRVVRDAKGEPTGVLIDQAMEQIENLIPAPTPMEVRRHLLKGMRGFNQAGFTHIRDMTCDEVQWAQALNLDRAGVLTLAVEEYFWLKSPSDLENLLTLVKAARAENCTNLRVMGLKIFLDGALGSEGALISGCYHGGQHGLKLWEESALREVFTRAWAEGLHVAVHAIGDVAVDMAVNLALELGREEKRGPLHIEHGELIRNETVLKMKGLDVQVHLQPAHWLSDRRWLKEKIGDLVAHAFPWRRLQENEIQFDFGSDAPIEPASLSRIFQALRESAEAGIPRLLGQPTSHLSHRDLAWAPNSFTLLEDERPVQVVFRGEHLI